MKENNLKLDDDTLLNAQNNAAYQWYYGCTPYYYSYYANMGYDPSSLFTPAYIDLEKTALLTRPMRSTIYMKQPMTFTL